MISDASKWVDINIDSWNYISGGGVEESGGGYKLNGSSIETDIELTGAQQATQYGLIYNITNIKQMAYRDNFAELLIYDESLNFAQAQQVYIPIVENGRVWFETPTQKGYKLTLKFTGDYTVSSMQVYGISDGTVGDATYTDKGVVVVDNTAGMVIADGKIGTNIGDGLTFTADGKITTTADLSGSNLQSIKFYTATSDEGMCVNGVYFFAKKSGGMQFLNGDRFIPVTKDTGGVASAYQAYIDSLTGGGVTDGE